MNLKTKFSFFSTLLLCLVFGKNLLGQNAPTESSEAAPIIETKKKVFFDVDWKTWFVLRGVGDKQMGIRFSSNKPIAGYDVYVQEPGEAEVKVSYDILKSKSQIQYKTKANYTWNNTPPKASLYLKDTAGIRSNVIPIEIAYRRFSSFRIELEALGQELEFEQPKGDELIKISTNRYSLNFNYHIVESLFSVAGLSYQHSWGNNFEQEKGSNLNRLLGGKNSSFGYFFKLKPIRISRLLLAPYYTRRYYQDKYTFNTDSILGETVTVKTKEDQFGLQAFLLFKNKRKNKHQILNLKFFYQYAKQTNETDFQLVEKSGFGLTLNYSFWFDNLPY